MVLGPDGEPLADWELELVKPASSSVDELAAAPAAAPARQGRPARRCRPTTERPSPTVVIGRSDDGDDQDADADADADDGDGGDGGEGDGESRNSSAPSAPPEQGPPARAPTAVSLEAAAAPTQHPRPRRPERSERPERP